MTLQIDMDYLEIPRTSSFSGVLGNRPLLWKIQK
jgi:hypothetical protein